MNHGMCQKLSDSYHVILSLSYNCLDWAKAWSRSKLHSETGLSWVGCNLELNSGRLQRFEISGNESSPTAACGDPVVLVGGNIIVISPALIIHAYTARPSCSIRSGMISDPGWSFILLAGENSVADAVFLRTPAWVRCWCVITCFLWILLDVLNYFLLCKDKGFSFNIIFLATSDYMGPVHGLYWLC